jgi:hypothetical protein
MHTKRLTAVLGLAVLWSCGGAWAGSVHGRLGASHRKHPASHAANQHRTHHHAVHPAVAGTPVTVLAAMLATTHRAALTLTLPAVVPTATPPAVLPTAAGAVAASHPAAVAVATILPLKPAAATAAADPVTSPGAAADSRTGPVITVAVPPTIAAVPEPSGVALAASGLAALVLARKFRRRVGRTDRP